MTERATLTDRQVDAAARWLGTWHATEDDPAELQSFTLTPRPGNTAAAVATWREGDTLGQTTTMFADDGTLIAPDAPTKKERSE